MGSVPSPAKSNVFVTMMPTFLGLPVLGMFNPAECGMILHVRRSIAIRDLPRDGALVHVVGRDPSVGWLDQAQTRN